MMISGKFFHSMRQLYGVLLLSLAALGGCAGESLPSLDGSGAVKDLLRGVVADEPSAALAMQEILSAGGSAVDAAVAGGFMMGVSLPSVAGLTGGGVCLAFDSFSRQIKAIDFLPRPALNAGMSAPMTPRGLALLHREGGRLPLERTLAPAERAARLGVPIARALAAHLATPGLAQRLDPESQSLFFTPDGLPREAGARLRQPELAALLGRLRRSGIGDLYTGFSARLLVEASQAAGEELTLEALQAALPRLETPRQQTLGNQVLATPGGNAGGGAIAADLYSQLQRLGFEEFAPPDRPQVFAEVTRRAIAAQVKRSQGHRLPPPGSDASARVLLADFQVGRPTPDAGIALPESHAPPGASLVAMDSAGNAVACAFTSGGLFGAGRRLPETGLFLPPPVEPNASLLPILILTPQTGQVFLAAAGTGGSSAAAAVLQVVSALFIEGHDLEEALFRPRQAAEGAALLIEADAEDSKDRLSQQGYVLTEAPSIGLVNAIHCPADLPRPAPPCDRRADPRGFGLALGAESSSFQVSPPFPLKDGSLLLTDGGKASIIESNSARKME